jgi:hypothetical protein
MEMVTMVLGEMANLNLILFERIVGKIMVEQDSGNDFTKGRFTT